MFQRGHSHSHDFARSSLKEETRWILSADLPLPTDDVVVSQEVVGFRFVTGTIIWLDIASSITMGKAPALLSHHAQMLSAGSQTQLRDIMGCENWVLLLLARISVLHENKSQAVLQGQADFSHFKKTASEITLGIEFSISHIPSANDLRGSVTGDNSCNLITRMFAYMAAVYLHLVMYGFDKLDLVAATFSSAVTMLQTQISNRLLPALVSPLFIIGSIAKPGDQRFFREILSSPPLLDPFLQHRARLLPILEQIWSGQETPGFSWNHCVELAKDILLV